MIFLPRRDPKASPFGRAPAIALFWIRRGIGSISASANGSYACRYDPSSRKTSFNAEQTEIIAKAFDDAWARLQGDEADPAMASLVRTALAKRM